MIADSGWWSTSHDFHAMDDDEIHRNAYSVHFSREKKEDSVGDGEVALFSYFFFISFSPFLSFFPFHSFFFFIFF